MSKEKQVVDLDPQFVAYLTNLTREEAINAKDELIRWSENSLRITEHHDRDAENPTGEIMGITRVVISILYAIIYPSDQHLLNLLDRELVRATFNDGLPLRMDVNDPQPDEPTNFTVYLNGKPVSGVTKFDRLQGIVVAYDPAPDAPFGKTVKLKGVVTLKVGDQS